MITEIFKGDIEQLRPVAEHWHKEANGRTFGLDMDINKHLQDMARVDDVLVLKDKDEIVGYMGLTIFTSGLSDQRIANEHCWYVIPQYRGISSIRLIKLAQDWAGSKGCSHLIMSASNLASDLHDRTCRIYERMGMTKFETSYISRT